MKSKSINGKTYWIPTAPELIGGLEVIIVCRHGNGEQKRRHRKRRINKKWLKRYGVWSGQPLNKGQAIIAEGKLLVSLDVYRNIKRAIKSRSIDPTSMYLPCNPDMNDWIKKLQSFISEKQSMTFVPYSAYVPPDRYVEIPDDLRRIIGQIEINRRMWLSRWFA